MSKKQETNHDYVWGKLNVEQAIRLWQTGIEVEKHFNDICIKIRNFANAFVSVFFSAIFLILALNFKNDKSGNEIYEAAAVHLPYFILVGQIIWGILWFKDRFWYHTFLIGAVQFCTNIEKKVFEIGDEGITHMITKISHEPMLWRVKEPYKAFNMLDFFYISISFLMCIICWIILFIVSEEKLLTGKIFLHVIPVVILVASVSIPILMLIMGKKANKKMEKFLKKQELSPHPHCARCSNR